MEVRHWRFVRAGPCIIPHIIPILLRYFVMSLQYQAAAPHAADVRRHHQWTWFATAGRSKKENGNAAYSHSRPTGVQRTRHIEHRIRTRETEIGERERAGVRENKGVQMSGRPAWPQQNVLPDLLPSSDSYRAIYRYGGWARTPRTVCTPSPS